MGGFFDGLEVDLSNLETHLAKANRDAAPLLVGAGKLLFKFRDHCVKRRSLSSDESNNIETIFSLASALEAAGVESVRLDDVEIPVSELIRDIRLCIWKVYQQAPWFDANQLQRRSGVSGVCEQFIRKFLQLRELVDRTTIVTTNYDLVMEYFIWSISREKGGSPTVCQYPLTEAHAQGFDMCCPGGERFVLPLGALESNSSIPFCKLHGSINYFDLCGAGNAGRIHVASDVGDGTTKIGKSGIAKSDRPTVFWVDAITQLRGQCGNERATPEFVPPTFVKYQSRGWLKDTWRAAFDALVSAKAIVFIGYSLPPSDAYLRSTLQAALSQRISINRPAIFVVDPSPCTQSNFEKLFGETRRIEKKLEQLTPQGLGALFEEVQAALT